MPRQQNKAHAIALRIGRGEDLGQGEDFCGPAAFGFADRLILGLPGARCPWRWTATMVTSIIA
jgi:hypothetical protein